MAESDGQAVISVDTEVTGLDLRFGAKPFLVTTCDEAGENKFWCWDVDPFTREPQVDIADLVEIEELIQHNDLALQNAKFDAAALFTLMPDGWLWEEWPWENTDDTLLAGHLLASNQPHDLTTMSLVYLDVNIQPYEKRVEDAVKEARRLCKSKDFIAKHGQWRLAAKGLPEMPSAKETTWRYDYWLPRAVAKVLKYPPKHPWWTVTSEYANADSAVTLPLFKKQEQLLKKRGLWEIYLERRKVLPVVADIESHGVTISGQRTKELKTTYTREAQECNDRCVRLSGGKLTKLSGGVTNELRSVIFDHLGLVSSRFTDGGKQSLDKFVLDEWLVTLPARSKQLLFVDSLRKFRKRSTALGYIDAYEKYQRALEGDFDEEWFRIFSSLNPTGTDTLRFASENPNGQQISKQEIYGLGDTSGHSARYMFGPAPGREWWSCDAKNIELRLPAYEAGETAMIDLFERPDDPPYFGSNHLFFFDILHPDLFAKHGAAVKKVFADTWYQWTKNGDFAVQYGAVAQSGTADRAYHVPGAQAKIEGRLTNIKKLSEAQIRFAEQHGYVETMPDKTVNPKRGYPLLCTRTAYGRILETVPLSYHVQGSAMWWMQKGMVRCSNFLKQWNSSDAMCQQLFKRVRTELEKQGYYLILQIHDELVFDFPKGVGPEPWKTNLPVIRECQRLMALGGDDLGVPTPVSCEYHADNWQVGMAC